MTPDKLDENFTDVVPEEATLGQVFMLLQRISIKQSLTQQEQVRMNRRLENLENKFGNAIIVN